MSLAFAVRLALRLARPGMVAGSTGAVLVVSACLLAMLVVLSSLSLSGEQVAQRDLGRFGASAGYGTMVARPGADQVVRELLEAASRAGATDPAVLLSATDLQLTVDDRPREVTLHETVWRSQPFPDRYELLSGRWPQRSGEVVVTDPGDVGARPATRLTAMGGAASLRVVGVADDRYARTSAVLAAPGTWGRLDPGLGMRFPLLRAQPALLWAGDVRDRVVAAVRAVAGTQGRPEPGAADVSITTREDLGGGPEPSWIGRVPAGYTVPSLLLPLAAVALTFGLCDRRFKRILAVLASLGIPRRAGAAAATLAGGAWCLAAAGLGAVIGTGAGLAARALTAGVRELPAGPVPDLALPMVRLLGCVLVGVACAGLVLATSPQGRRTRALPRYGARARGVRLLGALAAWCATVRVALTVDSPASAMVLAGVLTAAVLLLVPEAVGAVLRALPERGPRSRLSRRQLANDRVRAAASVALLATILGGSLGYLTLLDTLVRTADAQAHPDVLPGQLMVADRGSPLLPPPREVARAVGRSFPPPRARFRLRYLHALDSAGTATRSVGTAGSTESIMAMGSPTQVEYLTGRTLTPGQAEVLAEGGFLAWDDGPAAEGSSVRLTTTAGDRPVGRPVEMNAVSLGVDRAGWRVGTSGVVLTSTARRLGLPVTAGAYMYSGVSAARALDAQEAVVRAGLDGRTVQVHRSPPPAIPPAALGATAAGLALAALLASLAATRGQARTLRGYLGGLVAIGLPPRWARQILWLQHAVIVLLATLLGVLIGVPPVLVAAGRIPGFDLGVPWGQTLVLLTTIYAASWLAALHATRGLRPARS